MWAFFFINYRKVRGDREEFPSFFLAHSLAPPAHPAHFAGQVAGVALLAVNWFYPFL